MVIKNYEFPLKIVDQILIENYIEKSNLNFPFPF